jgi:copper resistance protein D
MFTALLIIARAVHIGASILIAGSFTFDVVALGWAGPRASDDLRDVERRLLRLALWSLVVALLSAVLWFWLEVVNMSGLSFANAFSATARQTVLLQTKFGHVWTLRLGLIAVTFVFAVLWLARDEARERSVILVLLLLSVVLLISLAWISHAAAAPVRPFGLLGDALHLCAAGAWIGGLVPLAIFLRRAGVSSSPGKSVVLVLERYSTLSLCCVSVLVVSGISNGWLLVGSIHALFTTVYGRLLLVKLALFGILLGFGARNRLAIKTNLSTAQTISELVPRLRRNVICEAWLGAAVVSIVAFLGVTPPGRAMNERGMRQHSFRCLIASGSPYHSRLNASTSEIRSTPRDLCAVRPS